MWCCFGAGCGAERGVGSGFGALFLSVVGVVGGVVRGGGVIGASTPVAEQGF